MENRKVVVFGPGPKFKGGIANYTESLAKSLNNQQNTEVHIVSWTQQYPFFIPREFIDASIKSDPLAGTGITTHYITNYNNPVSWNNTAKAIAKINPEIVVIQWAIAIQGLPLGYITKKLKKLCQCEIIFDLHVVAQKEPSKIDKTLIKYGLENSDSYIVHSYKTLDELKQIFPNTEYFVDETGKRSKNNQKTVIKLYHPIYDMFKPDPNFNKEEVKSGLRLKKHVFLFFGFIREYKGLHNVIKSFAQLSHKRDDVSLLIVGESFWNTLSKDKISTKIKNAIFDTAKRIAFSKGDKEREYQPLSLIEELNITDNVTLVNRYVPNNEVQKYFQVSDCNLLFYLNATPSGVESIAYNFNLPSLATKVGHFPETIKDGFNGYLAEPENIDSMVEVMEKFIDHPLPSENVADSAKNFSWENYSKAILNK
ncbi:MAG: glycosyltransferase [Melioribacteraceae bacterium]|nr:glycosyltransferase [Melioribacteraceae bacterium]